ncbi:MAG: hypothetical protein DHS20C13_08830 [Thermodesulfobacteriota bacterium]|nr:MAG: hypothetical protein DHS20C13_08830 [Thermodesulfobacteriota bacterium]
MEKPSLTHTWSVFYTEGDEQDNYAMYTYVLVGNRLSDQSLQQRYSTLLDAIFGTTLSIHQISESIPIDEQNIFYFPINEGGIPDKNNYNFELSKNILNKLSRAIEEEQSRFANNPGPFLVTSVEKLSDKDPNSEFCIIFTDFSDKNPAVIHHITARYQIKVSKNNNTSCIEQFEDFFAKIILNPAANANDYIKLVHAEAKELIY